MAPDAVPELVFNYRRERNDIWDLELLKDQHAYTTRYPADGEEGIVVSL